MDTARISDAVEQAHVAADRAARSVGVTVFILQEQDDIHAAERLFSRVWGVDESEPVMPAPLIKAFVHSGGYAAAAFSDGEMVGASVGFLGRRDGSTHLHSHATGVMPGIQTRGVGFALKQHQRAWTLDQGLDLISWTFDPLVRRNGYFNVTKLGAEITEYHPDFYGKMLDGINGESESDRCVVSWDLRSRRTIAAGEGIAQADPHIASGESDTVLTEGPDGVPVLSEGTAPTLVAYIPPDIVKMRQEDPVLAVRWRVALRECLQVAFRGGYAVTGMTKAGDYVLSRR